MIKRFATAAMLTLGLAGCFQPVYGPGLSGRAADFAAIDVAKMEGHLGFQLKAELDFLLTGGTPAAVPLYKLSISPRASMGTVVVDTNSGRPQVMTYQVNANYTLTDMKTGASIANGTASAFASYDRTQQNFASVRATRDAEIRAAKTLAEQIRARITPNLLALQK